MNSLLLGAVGFFITATIVSLLIKPFAFIRVWGGSAFMAWLLSGLLCVLLSWLLFFVAGLPLLNWLVR